MEQAAIPTTAADAVNKSGIEAPIGAPPARRKHSRHRYLRFTRRARRLSLIVTGLFGLGLRLSGAGVGIIFVILLGLEVTRHQVEIQPIAMPKPLAEAGCGMRSTGLPMRRRRPAAGHWRFRCTARLPKSLCQRSACRFPPSQPTSNASSAIRLEPPLRASSRCRIQVSGCCCGSTAR